jgi:hypothetical protein
LYSRFHIHIFCLCDQGPSLQTQEDNRSEQSLSVAEQYHFHIFKYNQLDEHARQGQCLNKFHLSFHIHIIICNFNFPIYDIKRKKELSSDEIFIKVKAKRSSIEQFFGQSITSSLTSKKLISTH